MPSEQACAWRWWASACSAAVVDKGHPDVAGLAVSTGSQLRRTAAHVHFWPVRRRLAYEHVNEHLQAVAVVLWDGRKLATAQHTSQLRQQRKRRQHLAGLCAATCRCSSHSSASSAAAHRTETQTKPASVSQLADWGAVPHDLDSDGGKVVGVERLAQRAQLVQHAPDGPDICLPVIVAPLHAAQGLQLGGCKKPAAQTESGKQAAALCCP